MSSWFISIAVIALFFGGRAEAQPHREPGIPDAYKDPRLPVETRVKDLLSRMTPEEKFWQLFMLSTNRIEDIGRCDRGAFGFQVGSFGHSACSAAFVDSMQRFFVEKTRLGIPVIPFDEALHGLVHPDATVFPQAIALAASFDTSLMHAVSKAIAVECRGRGIRQVLSPVVNIASDVRWGRTEETYGEDPFLSSQMGAAFVSEFEKLGVVTTPKHFIANVGDGGRDSYPIHLSERLLREIHLPPFAACILRGGSRSIMTSYNSLDGTPCTANAWLNDTLLKKELGFEGFVISDACAVGGANTLHFTTGGFAESARRAIESGLDVIFQTSYDHHSLFLKPFVDGSIDRGIIDRAVARVLSVKFELGLFDNPYIDSAEDAPGAKEHVRPTIEAANLVGSKEHVRLALEATNLVGSKEHVLLAREAALRSIVLLKNEVGTLPLDETIRSLAVIGADAVEARLGGYSGAGTRRIGILEGIRERAGRSVGVEYAAGCGRNAGAQRTGETDIESAVKLAGQSDVVIVVAGIDEGEFRDRASLGLPGRQEELIERVAAAGKPVVVVLVGGSAVTMTRWLDKVSAVLEVWYPGEQGGHAVAGILFGDFNPAGRLPVTFPAAEGQLPLVYNHKPTGRGDDYYDLSGEPLFPFGFGLSYTSFEYGDLSFDRARISPSDSTAVRFKVKNIGPREGDEVVQLYIRDEIASLSRPVAELKGFERVRLMPGEAKELSFVITPEMLSMLGGDMKPIVEPGDFRIMIGSSSKDIRLRGILTVDN